MKIERFEDVQGWQAGRVLARMVYEVTNKGDFARDFKLRDQIRDAAVSVMANIAEGFDAGSDAEFIRFLGYSRRSASEVQSHLYIALDQGYIVQKEFDAIYDKAVETKRLIGGFIRYLKSSPKSGSLKSGSPRSQVGKSQVGKSQVGKSQVPSPRSVSHKAVSPDLGLRTTRLRTT